MEVQINVWAVVWATVSSMVLGMVWYAKPVFGRQWQKLVGLKDSQMKDGAGLAIAQAVVTSALMAYVLAHVTYLSNYFFATESFMTSALMTAFWVWLGFSASTVVMHNAFEQRRKKLTIMTVVYQLVTLMVMGLIIGSMQP